MKLDREEIAEELFKQYEHSYGWDDVDHPLIRNRYLRMADWVIIYGLEIENRALDERIKGLDRCLKPIP